MLKTTIDFCGVTFKNPIVPVSGTFGFGIEYGGFYDLSELGGIVLKALTLEPREGNPPPRVAETPMGMLNSIGLQNPGVHAFIKRYLPILKRYDTRIIANIAGSTIEEYCEVARILDEQPIDMIELNISCPNVRQGGAAFGNNYRSAGDITKKVRQSTKKPLMVKLSPNVTDIKQIAQAVEASGADAISLINTILGMSIDVKTRRPILAMNVGGLSGPAVKPIAVRMVWQTALSVSIPIMGMGGVTTGEDAVEFMLAGASLVGVGTHNFVNPMAPVEIVEQMAEFCKANGIDDVNQLVGGVRLN